MEREIDGVRVSVDGEMDDIEIAQYVKRGKEKFGSRMRGLFIRPDGDEMELTYDVPSRPFTRIRRITGYLVGDLSRFNDGKRAEERDRVKHSI